jgi:pilus assembly protein CpaE
MNAEDMYRLLDVLSLYAGHVIVDTQTHIDEATLAILRRSTQLVLVGSTDIPALKDMKTAMQLLRKSGVSTEHAHLIINRASAGAKVDMHQIERTLHLRVDATVANDVSVPRSIGKRCPVVVQQPNGDFSHAMRRIAGILEESR